MGLFNDNYEDALYEARIATNFVKYMENKEKIMNRIVSQLRADLNFSLVPCNRDFVKTVMDKDIIDKYEPDNYGSSVVFGAPDRITNGFNPVEPMLSTLVDKFNMRDGQEADSNTAFLRNHFRCHVYTYDTMKNIDDEDTEIFWRRGYHIRNINTKTVNNVINHEVWKLYNALKKGNEDSIRNSLNNIRCVVAFNDEVQSYWNDVVCDEILEEKLDNVLSSVESKIKLEGKNINWSEEDKKKLNVAREAHRENFTKLRLSMKENLKDSIENCNKEAFFNALNVNSPEYKKYFVDLDNSAKRFYEIEEEVEERHKMVVAKKEEEKKKSKENYQSIAEKYTNQNNLGESNACNIEKFKFKNLRTVNAKLVNSEKSENKTKEIEKGDKSVSDGR